MPPVPLKRPGSEATSRSRSKDAPTAGRDVSRFDRFLQDQGKTNACGTTSLAMLMSFWADQPGCITHQKIDKSIRAWNGPTSPLAIARYLNAHGFKAVAKNNGSLDDLKRYLDAGVPVQVLYDPSAKDSDLNLHYVDVVGYGESNGKLASLTIADPSGAKMKQLPVEKFAERWSNLKLKNVPLGLNNTMVVALPAKDAAVVGRDGVVRRTRDIKLPEARPFPEGVKLLDGAGKIATGASKLLGHLKNVFE